MIPKVQVPMDFGIQYLGSPAHSNLRFLLAEGEELVANSMIISYNSPVIERLTTELLQSTVEVEEFSKGAVQSFLEASYSGQLKVSKNNFRHLNKMVHVLEVTWMADRCFAYFKSLLEELTEDNFEDQLYVFEEAMYMLTTKKKVNFANVVLEKFSSNYTQFFVPQYLSDISFCSTKQLDVIIGMVGAEQHILMEVLNHHLTNNTTEIDANTRYLLENVNFTACNMTHRSLYKRFLDNLEGIENPSKEDWTLIIKLLRQSQLQNEELAIIPKYEKIPNLFHSFTTISGITDFDALIDFLCGSPLVTNGYIFLEAVYVWLFNETKDVNICPVTITDNAIGKFKRAMTKRGWGPIARPFCAVQGACFGGFFQKVDETGNLTTDEGYYRITSTDGYSPDEFFSSDHDVKFHFEHPTNRDCTRKGDCGFILHVTAASSADSFNIQLVTDPNLYPGDIHCHDDIQSLATSMHFTIDIQIYRKETFDWDCPVTWDSKPRRDGSQKYWIWGANHFYKKGEGYRPAEDQYKWNKWMKHRGKDVKIRPVIYYFG